MRLPTRLLLSVPLGERIPSQVEGAAGGSMPLFIGGSILLFIIVIVTIVVIAFVLGRRSRKKGRRSRKKAPPLEAELEKPKKAEAEKTLICPYCRAENPPEAQFCTNCGASLEAG